MSMRTARDVGHDKDPIRGILPSHRSSTGGPSAGDFAGPTTRPVVWDRALDGPVPPAASRSYESLNVLDIVARVGLALFLTSGFVAALFLDTGHPSLEAVPRHAIAWIFAWCLALVGPGRNRRVETTSPPDRKGEVVKLSWERAGRERTDTSSGRSGGRSAPRAADRVGP
jgi:hypothetical protein